MHVHRIQCVLQCQPRTCDITLAEKTRDTDICRSREKNGRNPIPRKQISSIAGDDECWKNNPTPSSNRFFPVSPLDALSAIITRWTCTDNQRNQSRRVADARSKQEVVSLLVIRVGISRRQENKHWRFPTFPSLSCRVTSPQAFTEAAFFPPLRFYFFIISHTSMPTELPNIINCLHETPRKTCYSKNTRNTAAQLKLH